MPQLRQTSTSAGIANCIGSDHSNLVVDPNSISLEESCWQPNEFNLNWKLLPMCKPKEVARTHSMPNLLRNWRRGDPKQVIAHRGFHDNSLGVPENSMRAIMRALQIVKLVEVDVMLTRDNVAIVAHDFSVVRTTALDSAKCWRELTFDQVRAAPIIIRNVEYDRFTPNFYVTGECVVDLITCCRLVAQTHPDATLCLDAREEEAGAVIALASRHPFIFERCIIEFYPYQFDGADDLIRAVEEHHPSPTWKRDVALMAVVRMENLPKLAKVEENSWDLNALVEGAKRYLQSFFTAGLKVMAVSLSSTGSGSSCVDVATGVVSTPYGEVLDPSHKAACFQDLALDRLRPWVHQNLDVAVVGVNRGRDYRWKGVNYNYAVRTGMPYAWYEDARLHQREEKANPANFIGEDVDWVISDFFKSLLEAVAARAAGQPYVTGVENEWYKTKD